MIKARYSETAARLLFVGLLRPQLRASFHTVNLRFARGLNQGAINDHDPGAAVPVIYVANHSSWWDGHLAALMNHELFHRHAFTIMEESQLQRYKFFRYSGCFSVDRHGGRSMIESLAYASNCLNAPNRALLIFPQGEMLAHDTRPLKLFAGLARIIQPLKRVRLIPVAFRLEFIGEALPDAFISLGPALDISGASLIGKQLVKDFLGRITVALTSELDCMTRDIRERNFEDFTVILSGATSINRWWDDLRGKTQIRHLGPVKNNVRRYNSGM